MKITIQDLIRVIRWKDVKRSIKKNYPDDKNDYEKVFNKLSKIKPVRVSRYNFLEIYSIWNDFDKDKEMKKYFKKYLGQVKNGDEDNYYTLQLLDKNPKSKHKEWGVSFIPWNKMVSYPIDRETLIHITFVDIIAHFIWEITFYGTEKQAERKAEKIFKIVDEIKKDNKK